MEKLAKAVAKLLLEIPFISYKEEKAELEGSVVRL